MKRRGLPPRKLIRHLVSKANARGGYTHYWQPPSKLSKLKDKPDWLRSTPLKDDAGRPLHLEDAMRTAERLNARLETWRKSRGEVNGGMAALVVAYLKHSDFQKLAPRTRRDYEAHLAALKEVFGEADPADVTRTVVLQYREHLTQAKKLSPRQVDYRMQVLRLLFNFAKDQGAFKGDNPAHRPGIKKRDGRTSTWTVEQLRDLARRPAPVGIAVMLAVYTVQREGDILGWRWDQYGGDVLKFTQGKSGQAMELPVHPALKAALDAMPRKGAAIVAKADGSAYTPDGFRSIWHRAIASFGSPRPTFHDIRRTVATWLSRDGLRDAEVMLWTGHKREGSTRILDTYIVHGPALRERTWPIMDGWRVGISEIATAPLAKQP